MGEIKCKIKVDDAWVNGSVDIERDNYWEIRGTFDITKEQYDKYMGGPKGRTITLVVDLELLGKYTFDVMVVNIMVHHWGRALKVSNGVSVCELQFVSNGEISPCSDDVGTSMLDENRVMREIILAKKFNRPIDFGGIRIPDWIRDILEQELGTDA